MSLFFTQKPFLCVTLQNHTAALIRLIYRGGRLLISNLQVSEDFISCI